MTYDLLEGHEEVDNRHEKTSPINDSQIWDSENRINV
jgi:hypothetical protein